MTNLSEKTITLGSVMVERRVEKDQETGLWEEYFVSLYEPIEIPFDECWRYFELKDAKAEEMSGQPVVILSDSGWDYYVLPGGFNEVKGLLEDFKNSNKKTICVTGNLQTLFDGSDQQSMERAKDALAKKLEKRSEKIATIDAARMQKAEKISQGLSKKFGIKASPSRINRAMIFGERRLGINLGY